jgi:GT2 family glycosyltransferase
MELHSESLQKNGPTVSVVIVNLNGEKFISACIASVLEQIVPLEIIVVDNGSTDDSVKTLRAEFPHIKVIQNESNLGFAGPANQGAKLGCAEYLLFLNNDARLMPGALASLVTVLECDLKLAACQPTMRRNDAKLDSAGSMLSSTGFLVHVSEDDLSSERFGSRRFSLKGACLLVRSELFHQAGGFDNSFFAYFEETDLCWRLLGMGYELEHVTDALVIHDVGRTTTAIFDSAHIDYLSFRNRITAIRKNGDTRFKLRVLPVHVSVCVGVALAFSFTGKFRNALGILRAIAWHVRRWRRGSDLSGRPSQGTSANFLAAVTVPLKFETGFRMLKAYLVRW